MRGGPDDPHSCECGYENCRCCQRRGGPAMNLFVADPNWGWWIILYFYLGGIAAGAFFMATLIELFGGEEDEGLARAGYLIAFPLISLCGLFLLLGLEQPLGFWRVLSTLEVVQQRCHD